MLIIIYTTQLLMDFDVATHIYKHTFSQRVDTYSATVYILVLSYTYTHTHVCKYDSMTFSLLLSW